MNGNERQNYRGRCWHCGEPGDYAGGGRMTCPGCEVSWMPWPLGPRPDPGDVCWMGTVVDYVDFTTPEALGSPA